METLTENKHKEQRGFLSALKRLVMWPCRQLAQKPPTDLPPSFKTREEMDEMIFHAPARNAIAQCRLAGCDKDICDNAWRRHLEKCKERGIGPAT